MDVGTKLDQLGTCIGVAVGRALVKWSALPLPNSQQKMINFLREKSFKKKSELCNASKAERTGWSLELDVKSNCVSYMILHFQPTFNHTHHILDVNVSAKLDQLHAPFSVSIKSTFMERRPEILFKEIPERVLSICPSDTCLSFLFFSLHLTEYINNRELNFHDTLSI